MSRDAPPPLPGGYKVGEKVFYTGANVTVSNDLKWVHGQQGKVTGPATLETHDEGKGVSVLFPGNKGNVICLVTEVRSLRAASAATPRLRPTHTRRCPRTAQPPFRESLCTSFCPNPSRKRSRRSPTPWKRGGGGGPGAGRWR